MFREFKLRVISNEWVTSFLAESFRYIDWKLIINQWFIILALLSVLQELQSDDLFSTFYLKWEINFWFTIYYSS